MRSQLTKLREKRENGDHGFTLIELLVVVVIIGILVAIAIPVYLNFRKGAENRSAQSDTRNAVTAVEQCFNDAGQVYPASQTETDTSFSLTCGTGTTPPTQKVNISTGNKLTYTKSTDGKTYTIIGKSTDGGGIYTYTSSDGKTAVSGT